jgi:hypothetical protein
MPEEKTIAANVIPWTGGEWGVSIDYGDVSWRKYLVGSRQEAQKELARFTFDRPDRRTVTRLH